MSAVTRAKACRVLDRLTQDTVAADETGLEALWFRDLDEALTDVEGEFLKMAEPAASGAA
jgi:hypothetical protein